MEDILTKDSSVEDPTSPLASQGMLSVTGSGMDHIKKVMERSKGKLNNPLGLFPKEVWELILQNLMSSMYILNAFKALPQLQGQVLKNNYEWLFDQVIPHLYDWLGGNDVLACRQVSRRWCYGADNYLENHPHKKPYNFIKAQITQPISPPRCIEDEHFLFLRESGMSREFNYPRTFINFDRDMAGCPSGRNPFVGRSLWLTDVHVGNIYEAHHRLAYWLEAQRFLCKYGGHIWFLHIGQTVRKDYDFFCRFMLETLSLLPNLKGLSLEAFHLLPFSGSESEARGVLGGYCKSFQINCQPETLIMTCGRCETAVVPECLIKFLVMNSSSTIRRLCLCPCRCRWFGEYYNPFPTLTDFTLARCTSSEVVGPILGALVASKLTKLELQFGRNLDKFLPQGEIVTWLKHFPTLETFKLSTFNGDMVSNEGGELRGFDTGSLTDTNTILSVKSFLIENCSEQLCLELLKCFPNLEYLKVHNWLRPDSTFMRKLHGPHLWEMLPKMKELTLTTWQDRRSRVIENVKDCFSRTRATYEWLGRKRAERGSIQDLESIFECFTLMELGLFGQERD